MQNLLEYLIGGKKTGSSKDAGIDDGEITKKLDDLKKGDWLYVCNVDELTVSKILVRITSRVPLKNLFIYNSGDTIEINNEDRKNTWSYDREKHVLYATSAKEMKYRLYDGLRYQWNGNIDEIIK